MRIARHLPKSSVVVVLLLACFAAPELFADPACADEAIARIRTERDDGRLSTVDAAFLELQRIFDAENLPTRIAPDILPPMRCATIVVRDALRSLNDFDPERRAVVEEWLGLSENKRLRASTYLSPSGRFEFTYETSGVDSVPITDVSPANGVPDYIENIATYMDMSWAEEVTQLGFISPDVVTEPYPVSFEDIAGFGYATDANAGIAGTRIVLHRNFEGFRANDDPEGSVAGAAKVTCAHEFKHAIQFATSGWTEPGLWVELDATWVEDLVFDQVNDYIYFLASQSPITSPALPLDNGGSGSYAENIFQHWISETWGSGVVNEFWNRRALMPGEAITDAYDAALQLHGASLLEDFVMFSAWNQQTGTRALSGFAYEEASSFPDAPIAGSAAVLPAQFSSVVEHLASKTLRVSGFSGAIAGVVDVRVIRDASSPLRVAVITQRIGGGRVVEVLPVSTTDDTFTLSLSSSLIQEVEVVVANGDAASGPAQYTVIVDERIDMPVPTATVESSFSTIDVASGDTREVVVELRNSVPQSSNLDFEAFAIHPPPVARYRDISGSTLSVDLDNYTPGAQLTRGFIVRNGGISFEWLSEVHLTLPMGVSVISSTNMISESGQPLVTSGAVGEGITLSWFDPDGLWGAVMAGETGLASVTLAFDLSLVGDLTLDYRIVGDGFGPAPHEVLGSLTLKGPANPFVDIFFPDGGEVILIDQPTDVSWVAATVPDVAIDLSRNGGTSWETLVASTANDSLWSWTPTGPASENCLLRVRAVDDTLQSATSDAPFALLECVPWASLSPATGSVPAMVTETLNLQIDATALAPGNYDAVLYIAHNGSGGPVKIPIQAAVSASPTNTTPLPDRNRVVGVSPNPFNPATQIKLELAERSRVVVEIYDSRGRMIDRLIERVLPAGEHGVAWDSRDASGRGVASGTYYYRARIGDETSTGKMLLVK